MNQLTSHIPDVLPQSSCAILQQCSCTTATHQSVNTHLCLRHPAVLFLPSCGFTFIRMCMYMQLCSVIQLCFSRCSLPGPPATAPAPHHGHPAPHRVLMLPRATSPDPAAPLAQVSQEGTFWGVSPISGSDAAVTIRENPQGDPEKSPKSQMQELPLGKAARR